MSRALVLLQQPSVTRIGLRLADLWSQSHLAEHLTSSAGVSQIGPGACGAPQQMAHGIQTATHAVRSGDSHAGGSSISLSESDRS